MYLLDNTKISRIGFIIYGDANADKRGRKKTARNI